MAKAAREENDKQEQNKRTRIVRNFPALPFDDALGFVEKIAQIGGGNPVRRLTVFDELGKSPDSSASRMLITTASKYGLLKGSYKSEQLELTALGAKCVGEDISPREQLRARFEAAISSVEPFRGLYENHVGHRRPANVALTDDVQQFSVPEDAASEAVETFIVNLSTLGLIRSVSGAERILSLEHVLEEAPGFHSTSIVKDGQPSEGQGHPIITTEHADFETTCFYITPIGDEGTEFRKHSDLFLENIVTPALERFDLRVVRADNIKSSGSITRQVLEYIIKSRIVIADLSFHNPNVFYELAIRHATRKPVVQIVRSEDRVPFDIQEQRTIKIDNSSIYELVPRLETYRAEIASHVRAALDSSDGSDNPIATYFPNLTLSEK